MKVKKYGIFNTPTGKVEVKPDTTDSELKEILEKHPGMSRFIEDDNNTKKSTKSDTSKSKPRKSSRSSDKSSSE